MAAGRQAGGEVVVSDFAMVGNTLKQEVDQPKSNWQFFIRFAVIVPFNTVEFLFRKFLKVDEGHDFPRKEM